MPADQLTQVSWVIPAGAICAAGGRPAQVLSIFNDAGARLHTRIGPGTSSSEPAPA